MYTLFGNQSPFGGSAGIYISELVTEHNATVDPNRWGVAVVPELGTTWSMPDQ